MPIILKKLFDTRTFDSYLTVIQNKVKVREKYKKFKTKHK